MNIHYKSDVCSNLAIKVLLNSRTDGKLHGQLMNNRMMFFKSLLLCTALYKKVSVKIVILSTPFLSFRLMGIPILCKRQEYPTSVITNLFLQILL